MPDLHSIPHRNGKRLFPGLEPGLALERLYRFVDDLVSAKETKKRRPASRH
jgi:hypothetical protein